MSSEKSRWYELDRAVSQSDLEVDLHGSRTFALAPIEGILAILVPSNRPPRETQEILEGIDRTLRGAGITTPVLIFPDCVQFARFKAVGPDEASILDKQKAAMLSRSSKVEGSA